MKLLQLVVETQNGNYFDECFFGNIKHTLLKRLHDTNWEVKDSTVETVMAMAQVKRNGIGGN